MLDESRPVAGAGDPPPARRPDRHDPETTRRAAHRARAIIDAGPRAELAGAAEFLHTLLRAPDPTTVDGPSTAQPRGPVRRTGRTPPGDARSPSRGERRNGMAGAAPAFAEQPVPSIPFAWDPIRHRRHREGDSVTGPVHPRRHSRLDLITDAPISYDDELAARKRRYTMMMGMRIPLMVAAVFLISTPWLAAGLLVLSIPLPWMAVLIANDRLPRSRRTMSRYRRDPRSLEATGHPVIDS